jgi:hypothetical protein
MNERDNFLTVEFQLINAGMTEIDFQYGAFRVVIDTGRSCQWMLNPMGGGFIRNNI